MKRIFPRAAIVICAIIVATTTSPGLAKDNAEAELAITKLENEWLAAYVKADVAALERIASDDFILVDPSGKVSTKQEDIGEFKNGTAKWQDAKLDEIKVRVYGKTAIATGIVTVTGTNAGQDISGKYRITDVFVRKKETWRAVSSHVTAIAAKK